MLMLRFLISLVSLVLAVCCVSVGDSVAASHGVLLGPLVLEVAEAMSFREALRWIKSEFIYASIVLESDALGVGQAVRGTIEDNSYFSIIINYCKILLSELSNGPVSLSRSTNLVAHESARATNFMSDVNLWRSVPPF
ncbi:hypothetical protein Pfo_027327, partial [Paulownia fortunei]